jgi:hypothetical protein
MDVELLKSSVNDMVNVFINHHHITDNELIKKIRVSFLKWFMVVGIGKQHSAENLLDLWHKDWREIKEEWW